MRLSVLATLAAVTLTATVGCEKKPPAPAPDAGAARRLLPGEGPTILIGEVVPVTGDRAAYGMSSHEGVLLALNEANAAGGVKGKPLQLRLQDDGSKPEEAARLTARMIAEEPIAVVIGEATSAASLAMAKVAQEAELPMVTPSSTHPKVTLVGRYVFRVCFLDSFQGFVMAKFARENLGLKRVAVLKDGSSDYSNGLSDVFSRKFSEMGGLIVGTGQFEPGATDFRPQLTALKERNPEALFVPVYFDDVAVIARQARELGIRVPLLGGDGWDSEKLFELGGSAIEGSFFSNHYSPEDPSPRVQNFIASYRKAYGGKTPDSIAALGYDAMRVVVDALKRAPDLSGPAVREELSRTRDFPGVAGNVTLDRNGNPVKPAVVVQIRDGRQKYVATITP
jgi:branched-chain amino acid transport system substrate-binding protein